MLSPVDLFSSIGFSATLAWRRWALVMAGVKETDPVTKEGGEGFVVGGGGGQDGGLAARRGGQLGGWGGVAEFLQWREQKK